MLDLQKGKVKFFNGTEGKRYGFLKVEGRDTDLFFHFNDGAQFVEESGAVTLSDGLPVRDPRKGDTVFFFLKETNGGRFKAHPWGFAKEFEEVAASVAANRITYRITEVMQVPGSAATETVLFEGYDLAIMNAQFPCHEDYALDRLSAFSCSDYSRWTKFESRVGSAQEWEICEDPRTEIPDTRRRKVRRRG